MAGSKSNGNGQHVTGSARIVATAAPTANVEKADLTINTSEALAALQNHEIQARQDNKVNLLKKALDGYAALTTNFGPTDFVRGAAFNFLLDGAKDIDAECGYPPWLMPQQYNYMYDREPIANRVVTCLPEETWAEDPEIWEDDDPDTETPFEETWAALEEQHNLFSMIQRADVLSGIGQFGIILIGIDDGKDLREPVDGIFDDGTVDPEQEHKLLFLRVFSEVVVFVKVREIDITSPRYSQPKIYTIQFRDYPNWGVQAGEIIARDIHWTRVIHLADNRKESEVYGMPRMQPVYNRLYDLRKIYSSSGEGYWKGAFPGLAFEVNPEVAAQGVELDVKSIREEMERFQNGLQRYLALTGVTTKSLPATMMEPAGCVETHLRAIAICLGIPTRVLWGSEEAVLAGNQDSRAWNKRLAKRQTKYVNPLIIRPFINRLIAMGILPPPKDCMVPADGGNGAFVITGGYKIEWPDLNAPTDMDKAQVAAAETSAMAAYVQGGVSQLMAPREYLTHILGYSVQEADAILEASMEFSGDEEEPLSAASQAAQEQEAAEQQHDQALELQGAKGENTKPERNSAGLAANSEEWKKINHGDEVDGLETGDKIPNRGSIGSSFNKYSVKGLHEIPMSAFDHTSPDKLFYAKNDVDHSHRLAGQIRESGKIDPLIVAKDENGSYVLEGAHRLGALHLLGKKSFPALVVHDLDNGPEANAEKIDKDFILHNPDKGKLQAYFDVVAHRPDPNDPWRKGNQRTGEYVLRGLHNKETGEHRWADANHFEHGELMQGRHWGATSGKPLAEPMWVSKEGALSVKADGQIMRQSVEGGDVPHSVPGIGGNLLSVKSMGKLASGLESDSGGMETNSQWQDGWKVDPVQDKQERLARQILVNPSRSDLQHLLDTVHQHNQDNNISYSPFKIVLRGVSNDDGTKHNWGSSYFHEHRDLKQGDHSLDNHLYVATTGHIAKMGRMGGFEPFNVPAIGPKLDKVSAERVGMKTNAVDFDFHMNPSREKAFSELRRGEQRLVFTKDQMAMSGAFGAVHSQLASKAFGGEANVQGYGMLRKGKDGPQVIVSDEKHLIHPVVRKMGIPAKVGTWDDHEAVTNAEPPLHQQILTNPTKPDLQALFDTVHHRLQAAQALGSDDVVLRGVISRGGDKHVWGNAFQYEHEDLKDKSGDSDIAKGSHLYIHPSGKIFKFGKGYQEQEYNVPGIGSRLRPPTPPDTRTTPAGFQWGNRDEQMVGNEEGEYHTIEHLMSRIPLKTKAGDKRHALGVEMADFAAKTHNQKVKKMSDTHLFVARNHKGEAIGALHAWYGDKGGEITFAGNNGEQSGVGKNLMLHALHYAEQKGVGLQWDATDRSAKLYSRAGIPSRPREGFGPRFTAKPKHVTMVLDRGGRPELGEKHYPVSGLKINEEGE